MDSRARRACRSGGACSRRRITRVGSPVWRSGGRARADPDRTKTETERTPAGVGAPRLGPRTVNRLCRSWRFEGTRSVVRTLGESRDCHGRSRRSSVYVRARGGDDAGGGGGAARRGPRTDAAAAAAEAAAEAAANGAGPIAAAKRAASRRRRRRARRDGQGRDGGGGGASTIRVRRHNSSRPYPRRRRCAGTTRGAGRGETRPPPSPRGSRRRAVVYDRILVELLRAPRRVAQTANARRPGAAGVARHGGRVK